MKKTLISVLAFVFALTFGAATIAVAADTAGAPAAEKVDKKADGKDAKKKDAKKKKVDKKDKKEGETAK
jgi:hypothetical protein